jgi:hypothetical protein
MAATAATRLAPGDAPGAVHLLLTHLVAAVEKAPVCHEPYAHVYIENVFPDDFYRRILASFPDPKLYSPQNIKVWVRPNGESTRDRIFLTDEAVERFPDDRRAIWRTIAAAVTHNALKRILFRKLACDLALRFGIDECAVDGITSYPRMVLLRDTEQYRIKPHPDGLETIVTMQFYFPEDLSQEQLGTSLYRQRSAWETLLHGGQKFEEVKRFPFRPNSAYAFVVNNRKGRKSWHGVELVPDGIGVRNTLLNRYMASETDAAY